MPDKDKLEYGGVAGITRLTHCCIPENLPQSINQQQRMHFSGIQSGYFGFLFEQASPLPFMPCRGKLGIFDINLDTLLSAPALAQTELF